MAEPFKKLILGTFVLASVIALGTSQSYASVPLFDRGLPIYNGSLPPPSNINGTTNANRSNFSILFQYTATQPTTYQIGGDDFSLGKTGQTYHINIIRVWMLYGVPSSQYDTTTLAVPTFPLTLWFGPAGGNIQSLTATPTLTRIWYSDGSNYQRTSDGAWRGVWQVDFAVNLKIKGGQKYQFFLDGLFKNNVSGLWQSPSLGDANEALSNNPHQDGADNQYLALTLVNGTPSGAPGLVPGLDANVQIFGNLVTAQAALDLLLLGE